MKQSGIWIPHYECSICGESVNTKRGECPFCHSKMVDLVTQFLDGLSNEFGTSGEQINVSSDCFMKMCSLCKNHILHDTRYYETPVDDNVVHYCTQYAKYIMIDNESKIQNCCMYKEVWS